MSAKSPRGAGGGATVVLCGRNGATQRPPASHLVYIYSQRRQSEAAAVHTGDLKSLHTELKEMCRQHKKIIKKKNENVKREKKYRILKDLFIFYSNVCSLNPDVNDILSDKNWDFF